LSFEIIKKFLGLLGLTTKSELKNFFKRYQDLQSVNLMNKNDE